MNLEEKKTKTGDLGERLVARYFRNLGFTVEESLDLFDRTKDLLVEGETCEVKTQQLWHTQKAFTVKYNQLNKCTDVDHLIFVETPSKYNNMTVRLYEFSKSNRKFTKKITKDGRIMYLIKISYGDLLTSITDDVIVNQFVRYSASDWR